MKIVWTDTNKDRAAVSLSRAEIEIMREALDTEVAQLTCMAALNNTKPGENEAALTERSGCAETLKQRFDDIAVFMDEDG